MTDVRRLQWPAEAVEREKIRSAGMPCLLLVTPGSDAPVTPSAIEDWAWSSAATAEIEARVRSLQLASDEFVAQPTLDEFGVLTYRNRRATLPPVEARLVTELLIHFGGVVSREQLSRAAWGAEAPGRNALDVHVLRIRRRLETVGLIVRTVRSRGYLLDSAVPQPVLSNQ